MGRQSSWVTAAEPWPRDNGAVDDHHSHSHSAAHGLQGGWDAWLRSPQLRAVLVAIGLAAIATIVGAILLWPTDAGRQDAIAAAEELGLATDRVDARVVTSENAECTYSTIDNPVDCRLLTLDILDGPDAGSVIALPEINLELERSLPELSAGDGVVLGFAPTTNTYFFEDTQRSNVLIVLALIFAVIVIVFARVRGVLALLAMSSTVAILVLFVAPSVLDGNDPVLVAVVAASAIAFISLFLTHGFSPTTTVALAGTLAALSLTLALSAIFFNLAAFTGFASSESLVLPFLNSELRLSSLLLGGAVIGALGALDDVTVTQVSTVAELRRNSPELPTATLMRSALEIGRDHIAATVNTLLLAYAGASLPVLLLFAASEQSLGSVANSELIAVEIVRTLCGSIGLIAAVPLTTALAAAVLPPQLSSGLQEEGRMTLEEPLPKWDDFAPDPQNGVTE